LAARYLSRRKYRILARNYRRPLGEIDLIAADGDVVVFIEVKTRRGDEHADARDAVRPSKWRRIHRAARCFLSEHRAQHAPCRFDVVTIVWPAGGSPRVEHEVDAYQPRSG
jgi:putative endonuclease